MKLYKFAIVAAAVAALTLVSCGKNNDDDKKTDEPAPLTATIHEDVAAKVVVTDLVTLPLRPGKALKQIDFTETDRAVITEEIIDASAPALSRSSDAGKITITITTYSYKDGKYSVSGFCDVTINDEAGKVTIEAKNSAGQTQEQEVAAEVTTEGENTGGTQQKGLYRAWKIASIDVKATGPRVNIGLTFPNGDLKQIADWLKENKVEVPDEYTGYNIKTIQFTKAGSFIVEFTKADPFKGDFQIVGDAFEYKLAQEGNSLLNAEAHGTVKVQDPYCNVVINGQVKNGSETWTTKLAIKLIDADAN